MKAGLWIGSPGTAGVSPACDLDFTGHARGTRQLSMQSPCDARKLLVPLLGRPRWDLKESSAGFRGDARTSSRAAAARFRITPVRGLPRGFLNCSADRV